MYTCLMICLFIEHFLKKYKLSPEDMEKAVLNCVRDENVMIIIKNMMDSLRDEATFSRIKAASDNYPNLILSEQVAVKVTRENKHYHNQKINCNISIA